MGNTLGVEECLGTSVFTPPLSASRISHLSLRRRTLSKSVHMQLLTTAAERHLSVLTSDNE